MRLFRAICSLCLLIPGYALVLLAHKVCPQVLDEPKQLAQGGIVHWWEESEGWERRVH